MRICRHPPIMLVSYYCGIAVMIICSIIPIITIKNIWIGNSNGDLNYIGGMLFFNLIVCIILPVVLLMILYRIQRKNQFVLFKYMLSESVLEVYNPIGKNSWSVNLEDVHSVVNFYTPYAPVGIRQIGHHLKTNTTSVELSEMLPIWNDIKKRLNNDIQYYDERWQDRKY